jgi:hypothetical protein
MPEGKNRPEDIRADTRPSVAVGLFIFLKQSCPAFFFFARRQEKKTGGHKKKGPETLECFGKDFIINV